ncbi:MAG: hypothetical protein D6753_00385 [Planctomycetota bacterium]|nr:MAG: hypothetical protein D6753_00385 [Planctomycetota bacterium]
MLFRHRLDFGEPTISTRAEWKASAGKCQWSNSNQQRGSRAVIAFSLDDGGCYRKIDRGGIVRNGVAGHIGDR